MTPEELRRRVGAQAWFHRIDLGHGIVTPGIDETQRKLGWLRLPESFAGKSVLDIGAWDGAFSFEAERRGASRVLAVDSVAWQEPAWGPKGFGTKAGFELAREALGSGVEDTTLGDFDELSPQRVGTWDVVLYLGVLYHMKHPWFSLERVAGVCEDLLILETHADLLELRRPAMAIYPGAELNDDASNWCGPNLAALEAMLRTEGFRSVEVVHREPRVQRLGRAVYRRFRPPRYRVQAGRVVIHARR